MGIVFPPQIPSRSVNGQLTKAMAPGYADWTEVDLEELFD